MRPERRLLAGILRRHQIIGLGMRRSTAQGFVGHQIGVAVGQRLFSLQPLDQGTVLLGAAGSGQGYPLGQAPARLGLKVGNHRGGSIAHAGLLIWRVGNCRL